MNTVAPQVSNAEFFAASDIARALSTSQKCVHPKTVKRVARRESWPEKFDGYRTLFQPPAAIAEVIVARPAPASAPVEPQVRFADLAHSEAAREIVLLREKAVQLFHSQKHLGCEVAYETCSAIMRANHAGFKCTSHSLRHWVKDYVVNGIDGLVEQKRGRVGRKAFANDLEESHLLKMTADAVGHGNWKRNAETERLNIATAFRNLIADPTVEGPARLWLHGDRASKSSVPPSVRDAIRARCSPLTATLMQVGAKAAKLDGAFTECSYENVKAGDVFTADDMTANCYVWTEWPNEQGFILIRPQILAAMDVGTMSWLNLRAVMRPKGQYNSDDVWGLIGDIFDEFGLFKTAVLEGGIWQSDVVVGTKTGIDNETRFGGLKSLGVKLIHTRTPRGKIIETAFNVLQHAADNVRGYCGRDERRDCPEEVRVALANVRSGKSHAREFFLHISEYAAHLQSVMKQLNNERGDGKILRGQCPAEKWAQDAPQLAAVRDDSKWMYRAAYRVTAVTRNGVRIAVGSGKFQTFYSYASPALEIHRGRRVIVFWNDYDPDTDAVVYTLKSGRPDKLICVAPRVQEIPRFGAEPEQLRAESARKKMQMKLAVTQRKSLAPFLQRSWRTATGQSQTAAVGEQIQSVRERAEEKRATKARTRQLMRAVEIPDEFKNAGVRAARPAEEMSETEMNEILRNGQNHPLLK